jgi:hypothetical protein
MENIDKYKEIVKHGEGFYEEVFKADYFEYKCAVIKMTFPSYEEKELFKEFESFLTVYNLNVLIKMPVN